MGKNYKKLVLDWRSLEKNPRFDLQSKRVRLHYQQELRPSCCIYMHVVRKLYDMSAERVNVFSTTAQQIAAGF
jgi:hypothetical protein